MSKRVFVTLDDAEVRKIALLHFDRPAEEADELVRRIHSFNDELLALVRGRKDAVPPALSGCEDTAELIVILAWLASAKRSAQDPDLVSFVQGLVENQVITRVEESEVH